MGYLDIDNLYKSQDILLFRECYALEKIHGTSTHLSWKSQERKMNYSSGGEKHDRFVGLFNTDILLENAAKLLPSDKNTVIYGEAYGGKQQKMSQTYGPELKFIVFDIQIGDCWLNVPNAESLAISIGLEFVYYEKISTDMASIDAARNWFSNQAKRNGIVENKIQEGVVLRPLIELKKNNGERIICKHKNDEFKETKEQIPVDPAKREILDKATLVAEQWVVPMRLEHVLDKMDNVLDISKTGDVVMAMIEDVRRESDGLVVWTKEIQKEVGKLASKLYVGKIKEQLNDCR